MKYGPGVGYVWCVSMRLAAALTQRAAPRVYTSKLPGVSPTPYPTERCPRTLPVLHPSTLVLFCTSPPEGCHTRLQHLHNPTRTGPHMPPIVQPPFSFHICLLSCLWHLFSTSRSLPSTQPHLDVLLVLHGDLRPCRHTVLYALHHHVLVPAVRQQTSVRHEDRSSAGYRQAVVIG